MKRYNKIFTMSAILVLLLFLSPHGAAKKVTEKVKKTTTKTIVVEEKGEVKQNAVTPVTPETTTRQLISPVDETIDPVIVEPATTSARRVGTQIGWWIMSTAGGLGSSTGFIMNQTIGQFVTGNAASAGYGAVQGFWGAPMGGGGGGCCVGLRGNANGSPDDIVNISDVTFMVDFLFGIPLGPAPVCPEESNANGSPDEVTNISDITFLVNFLFGVPLGAAPDVCP